MRKSHTALLAVFVLASSLFALEGGTNPGIEVLGIEVLSPTEFATTHTAGVPPGCMVVAVMDLGAGPVEVDMQPVDPLGINRLTFPVIHPSNQVQVRAPDGTVLCSDYLGGEECG